MKIYLDNQLYATLEEALPHLSKATEIEVWDCNALTAIEAPLATRVSVRLCDGVTSIDAPLATRVSVRYCNALTAIETPLATSVAVDFCKALTSIEAPLATSVEVTQCASLTVINAPLVTSLEVRGCTALTKFNSYQQLSDAQCEANLKIVAEIALASPGALQMDEVHVCDTTHCIAGTATHFLEGGKDMEAKLGWYLAGQFLLGMDAACHFGDNQEDGRKYLQGVLAEV